MYRQTQGTEGTEALERMYHGICHQPTSSYALSAIAEVWPQILNLERREADLSIHLRYHHYGIMLTNYFAWWWLDCFVVGQVKGIMEKTATSSDNFWLTKLVNKITDIRFARITSYTFDPIKFDGKLRGQVFEYQRHPRTMQWDSDPEQDYKEVASTVVEIVQHWLRFPTEGAYRQKAWFVHALLQEFGQSVLLLDQTWNAYDTMKRSMFSIPRANLQSFDSVQPLREAARQHPLHDPKSEEHKVLDRITESILAVCNVNLPIDGRTSAPNTLTPAVQSVLDRRLTVFTAFVREAVRAVLQPNSRQDTSATYKAMIANPDQFLPFREHAPSRIRFKSPDGPFHESVVRTRSGLFSALIWRGITFTAPFSLERKMVFRNLQEFQEEVSEVGHSQSDSGYTCNQRAYGIYNKFRSPELAKDYWEATGKHNWSSFVKNHTVPFTDCYQQFFRPGKAPVRFPQIGPLAAYLLTADYVYAGVVDPPTLDEISDVVRCINRGAASCLEHLGLIGPRVKNKRSQGYSMPNEAECRGAIRKIHQVLTSVISIEEQQYLPVDGILVEHISCKFSRCVGKGIIKL